MKVLHLVLTFNWYFETAYGDKRIEYRAKSDKWMRDIWQKRDQITHVKFQRGYTSTKSVAYVVDKIDMGPCPLDGWDGEYIRIHFHEEAVKAECIHCGRETYEYPEDAETSVCPCCQQPRGGANQ